MCEDDLAVFCCPNHDLPVVCAGVPDIGPMNGVVMMAAKTMNQLRGKVHVKQDLHCIAIGMSISAALHAE